jgi:hypothetical protein
MPCSTHQTDDLSQALSGLEIPLMIQMPWIPAVVKIPKQHSIEKVACRVKIIGERFGAYVAREKAVNTSVFFIGWCEFLG